jgi:hypothetical protein
MAAIVVQTDQNPAPSLVAYWKSKMGFLDLSDYMFAPGHSVDEIVRRLPRVAVPYACAQPQKPVKFVHMCTPPGAPAPVALMFRCGTMPHAAPGDKGCLVADFVPVLSKRALMLPIPDPTPQPAPSLAALVSECVSYVLALRTDTRQGALSPRCLPLLLLAIGDPSQVAFMQLAMNNRGAAKPDGAIETVGADLISRRPHLKSTARLAVDMLRSRLWADPDTAVYLHETKNRSEMYANASEWLPSGYIASKK